jgi:hypothetical protein
LINKTNAEHALDAIPLLSAIVNDDRNAIKYLIHDENFDLSAGCIGMANLAAYLVNVISIAVNHDIRDVIMNMVYFFEMQVREGDNEEEF